MKTKNIINFALTGLLLSPVIAINEANASIHDRRVETALANIDSVSKENIKPAFLEKGKPKALNSYWHKMAKCETNSNWKDHGKWSGGLGIYTRTWIGFGGLEFANKPEFATIEQQIIIANRISTQGYQTTNVFLTLKDKLENRPHFRNPVGFNGWGCMKNVGKPILFTKPPYKIFFKKYKLNERSNQVRRLQEIIGMTYIDGRYGSLTRKAHRKYLRENRKEIIDQYNKYR